MTVHLRHLNVQELIGAAAGDPWQLNKTIQAGAPGEINQLARAFYAAGVCMGDTSEEFSLAKQRFEAAWDRKDDVHPINDSAEVKYATESLNLNKEQMACIAVDLENISASLAEAQRSGQISIGNLESALQFIDNQIDLEFATAAADGQELDWSELKQAAIDRTRQALQEVQSIRDAYEDQLDKSRLDMAAEGYNRDTTAGAAGDGTPTPNQQAHADAEKYWSQTACARRGPRQQPRPVDTRETGRPRETPRLRHNQ